MMTSGTTHTVTGQRTVFEVRIILVSDIHKVTLKVSVSAMVQIELALPHHAMAAKARVNNLTLQFFTSRDVFDGLQVN